MLNSTCDSSGGKAWRWETGVEVCYLSTRSDVWWIACSSNSVLHQMAAAVTVFKLQPNTKSCNCRRCFRHR
jgi:hypothetical protein